MREILEQVGIWAVIDIAIVTFAVYHILLLIKGTRTAQVLTGILIIGVGAFVMSIFVPLTTVNWVMNKFYSSFIIIIVILFQDDIRRVLSRIGKKPFIPGGENFSSSQIFDEITRAAATLAGKRIGALIVIERNIILSRYVDVGVLLDARVSTELLVSIFHATSPIHDGAVIIQQGRVSAAGCFLPLSREDNIDPTMGTRHRAALGISQETDALVVLVSEERGTMSLVVEGKISRNLEPKEMRKALRALIVQDQRRFGEGDETSPPEMRGRARSTWNWWPFRFGGGR
jgi:diadenylate cyclase